MSKNQNEIHTDNRRSDRLSTDLKTIVQVKESLTESWKEVVDITTVSRNGAGFSLTRSVSVGRLVSLVLPLPNEFRAYDDDKDLYPVLGLVQHCTEVTIDGTTSFQIGVGFVGKEVPESYKQDPAQNYRFTGVGQNGLWLITEAKSQFKKRSDPRFWKAIEFTVSQLKRGRDEAAKTTARSKDISASGLSIPCSLDLEIGEKVKVACKPYDFYAIAEVRNRQQKDDTNEVTLHLKFVDQQFPMHSLHFENAPEIEPSIEQKLERLSLAR